MEDESERAQSAKKGCPFLNTEQAAYYLGLSPRTLQRKRSKGGGPPYRRHFRFVRYHVDELDTWSREDLLMKKARG